MGADEGLTPISDNLDRVLDVALDYAMSMLAGGERLQPAASYESQGEVSRAFFLGLGNPDPVIEAKEWVASLPQASYAVITYPGEVHYKNSSTHKAILAEAWEEGMPEAIVVAQEYQPVPDGDPEQGTPLFEPVGNQLELGHAKALWETGGEHQGPSEDGAGPADGNEEEPWGR